jgi:hypothetical protein
MNIGKFPTELRLLERQAVALNVSCITKLDVIWDVAPCSLVEIDQRFKGAYFLHLQGVALILAALSASETSVNFY